MIDKILQINKQINRAIKYKTGASGWQLDYLPDGGEGDCDTYAYTKYKMLKDSGLTDNDMRFVAVKNKFGGDHLVLRVNVDNKPYYLDDVTDVMWNEPPGVEVIKEYHPLIIDGMRKVVLKK
jgi:predicted transglutaminase-like cysteine proteinase